MPLINIFDHYKRITHLGGFTVFEPSIAEDTELAPVFSEENSEIEYLGTQSRVDPSRTGDALTPRASSRSPLSNSFIDIEEHEAHHLTLGQKSSVSL